MQQRLLMGRWEARTPDPLIKNCWAVIRLYVLSNKLKASLAIRL